MPCSSKRFVKCRLSSTSLHIKRLLVKKHVFWGPFCSHCSAKCSENSDGRGEH